MNAILSADNNWGIGYQGKLLASVPEDMQFFRKTTLNKVVVMGRKTLNSLPKGATLKNRTNIILSSTLTHAEGGLVCSSLKELFKVLENYSPQEVFVMGGEEIYKQLLPYCSLVYVTRFYASLLADTHFPNLQALENWRLLEASSKKEFKGLTYDFATFERTK